MKDVTRIKRLLEMKRRASMLPKAKLADFEEEYAELLERIEFERKRLEIDEKSIRALKDTIAFENGGRKARERVSVETASLIRKEEKAIDRAARFADLEDLEYHKNKLIELWRKEHIPKCEQLTMYDERSQ